MKIFKKITTLALLLTVLGSCSQFLEVEPTDKLTANNFWKDGEDARKAVYGAYQLLLEKFLLSTLYNVGDFRAGNWDWFEKRNLEALGTNDLLSGDMFYQDNTGEPKDWTEFYRTIAAANLCIDRIPDIEDPGFSEAERKALVAEARFIRAFTYFYMVRLYGDVPLNNDAYNTDSKPKTNMLEVLKVCIEDLAPYVNDLPLQYQDPTNRAVRATQGSALTLLAHMYMWMAGFDKGKQQEYWQKAAELSGQVMDLGVYRLLPYTETQFHEIFKGRSDEGIFELSVDINYGVEFHSLICQWTLHRPIINSSDNVYGGYGSEIVLQKEFIDKLYPPGEPDKRFDIWFDDPYCTANPQSAMFLKFSSVSNPIARDYDANFILFRYSGLILLRAEALAALGQTAEAIKLLNMVRKRAGARDYTGGGGQSLRDFIFLERERELMGEGWRWYDLVRTGRVKDPTECENYLTTEEFNLRAWTWPIDGPVLAENPLISQNAYWR